MRDEAWGMGKGGMRSEFCDVQQNIIQWTGF